MPVVRPMGLLARLEIGALVVGVLAGCASDRERAATSMGNDTWEPPERGSCENSSLAFGPVSLPSAAKGGSYEARLIDHAKPSWRGLSYHAGSLPAGLELTGTTLESLTVRGVPTSAGSFEFAVEAVHGSDSNGCSTMPDPHTFHLDIAADAGDDASADAGLDAHP